MQFVELLASNAVTAPVPGQHSLTVRNLVIALFRTYLRLDAYLTALTKLTADSHSMTSSGSFRVGSGWVKVLILVLMGAPHLRSQMMFDFLLPCRLLKLLPHQLVPVPDHFIMRSSAPPGHVDAEVSNSVRHLSTHSSTMESASSPAQPTGTAPRQCAEN